MGHNLSELSWWVISSDPYPPPFPAPLLQRNGTHIDLCCDMHTLFFLIVLLHANLFSFHRIPREISSDPHFLHFVYIIYFLPAIVPCFHCIFLIAHKIKMIHAVSIPSFFYEY